MTIKTGTAELKVTVTIERRADGGLYVYCDDLPGFVLSHLDAQAVVADIAPAAVKPIIGSRDGAR